MSDREVAQVTAQSGVGTLTPPLRAGWDPQEPHCREQCAGCTGPSLGLTFWLQAGVGHLVPASATWARILVVGPPRPPEANARGSLVQERTPNHCALWGRGPALIPRLHWRASGPREVVQPAEGHTARLAVGLPASPQSTLVP